MKYTFITLLTTILALITISATNPNKDITKNGIIYYLTSVNGKDTTYTIFSAYNVKQNLEYEIGDTLIKLYKENKLPDFIDIKTSKAIVYGTCNMETYQKATLVDYTIYKYKWNDGRIENIENKTKY